MFGRKKKKKADAAPAPTGAALAMQMLGEAKALPASYAELFGGLSDVGVVWATLRTIAHKYGLELTPMDPPGVRVLKPEWRKIGPHAQAEIPLAPLKPLIADAPKSEWLAIITDYMVKRLEERVKEFEAHIDGAAAGAPEGAVEGKPLVFEEIRDNIFPMLLRLPSDDPAPSVQLVCREDFAGLTTMLLLKIQNQSRPIERRELETMGCSEAEVFEAAKANLKKLAEPVATDIPTQSGIPVVGIANLAQLSASFMLIEGVLDPYEGKFGVIHSIPSQNAILLMTLSEGRSFTEGIAEFKAKVDRCPELMGNPLSPRIYWTRDGVTEELVWSEVEGDGLEPSPTTRAWIMDCVADTSDDPNVFGNTPTDEQVEGAVEEFSRLPDSFHELFEDKKDLARFMLHLTRAIGQADYHIVGIGEACVDIRDSKGDPNDPNANTQTLLLRNLAKAVKIEDHSQWDATIRRWVGAPIEQVSEGGNNDGPASFDELRDRVFPVLYDQDSLTLQQTENQVYHRAGVYGTRVSIGVDSPNSIRHMRADEVAQLGCSEDELYEAAIENLRRGPALREHTHQGERGGEIVMLDGAQNYTASHILLEDTLKPYDSELGVIYAVPCKEAILVLPIGKPGAWMQGVYDFKAITDKFYEGFGHPVSPNMYWRRDGKTEILGWSTVEGKEGPQACSATIGWITDCIEAAAKLPQDNPGQG